MTESFAVFDTPMGTAGVTWTERGISGVHLPEPEAARLRARLRRRLGGAAEASPPILIGEAIERIRALLSGQPVDLTSVPLDMTSVPPFDRHVYDVARTIPPGQTLSYGDVARRLGDVRLARDVGQALAHNPFAIVVPCHRVIATGGKLGGFSARGGVSTKQRLLEVERANVGWQLSLEV